MNIDLSKFCGGALQARFNRELEKVVKNMKDPNTPYKDARKIIITLTLKQKEDRQTCTVNCDVEGKTSKARSFDTNLGIGQDLKTGEFIAKEYGTQIPGQMEFEDLESDGSVEQQGNVKKFEGRKLSPAIGG